MHDSQTAVCGCRGMLLALFVGETVKRFLTLDDPVVPMHHPRVLVETAVAQGVDEDELLHDAGMAKTELDCPDARLSYLQFGRLALTALRLTDNPALGLDFGERVTVSNLGILGLGVSSSPDARSALETGLRYSRTVVPGWDLTLDAEGERARLRLTPLIPFGPLENFATEALLAGLVALTRAVAGEFELGAEVFLPYPRPSYAKRLASDLNVSLHFDEPATWVEFDARVLEKKLPTPDPVTAKLAERFCASELATELHDGGLLEIVSELLRGERGNRYDEPSMAAALRTSPRSLRRGLRQFGTSFQTLRDEARRDQALSLLQNTQLSVERIAEKLGFSDARSFRRAYKRWTGQTPSGSRPPSAAGL